MASKFCIFLKSSGIVILVHGIAVSHVLNKLSVYASIATHREGDGHICLPVLVGDLEKLLLGELFGVGDDRNFVGE